MPVNTTTDELFAQLLAATAEHKLPPVASWQPTTNGVIDIRISADGRWWHEGGEIKRPAMVRLFASILRKDPDGYCLVTPAERLLIDVEDAPFVALDLDVRGAGTDQQELLFTTNVGEHVLASEQHSLWVVDSPAGPRPYVEARPGLPALLTRAVFYRLIEYGYTAGQQYLVRSAGRIFPLGSLS